LPTSDFECCTLIPFDATDNRIKRSSGRIRVHNKTRGTGLVYQPTYRDKRSGDRKKASTLRIQYSVEEYALGSSNSSLRRDAEHLLRARLEAAARGEPVRAKSHRNTFEQLAEILLDNYTASGRRSISRVRDALTHLRGFFGEVRANRIGGELLERYKLSRQEQGAAAATINRELAALRRALNLAQSKDGIKSLPKIVMLPEVNRRRRATDYDEYQRILDGLPGYLRPAIETAYVTGWRINSEILPLPKNALDSIPAASDSPQLVREDRQIESFR
jgi:hypothetical protein